MSGLSVGRTPPSILSAKTSEIIEPLRDVAELRRHLGQQLAVVPDLDRGELLGVARDQVAEAPQQLAAGGGVERRPWPFRERLVGGLDRER